MSCAISQLILESIRTWMVSSRSLKVLAGLELRWIEIDALAAWPALEEFLAIIFFERRREIAIAPRLDAAELTSDETALLISLIVARWDSAAAARCLRGFLGDASAGAAARAAARLSSALSSQPALTVETIFSVSAFTEALPQAG